MGFTFASIAALLLFELTAGLPSQIVSPWAVSYAALGDSYAAGDGVGSSKLLPNLDSLCGRFSAGYPYRIANEPKLHVDPWDFDNVACGGATSTTVLQHQSRHLDGKELGTIQVGGNEVDFFLVLNECIQQWKPLSTCEAELTRSRTMMQSTRFLGGFDAMVAGASKRMTPGGKLMILGYATFFNEETTQCNQVTFSKTDPTNFLTNELRKNLNGLVRMLNEVIEASARAHGAIYLDVDKLFEGHRFCEEGVIEPHPDWEGTWFFRESTKIAELGDMKDDVHGNGFEHVLKNPLKDFIDLTKTFHPTAEGHEAIAKDVVQRFLGSQEYS